MEPALCLIPHCVIVNKFKVNVMDIPIFPPSETVNQNHAIYSNNYEMFSICA